MVKVMTPFGMIPAVPSSVEVSVEKKTAVVTVHLPRMVSPCPLFAYKSLQVNYKKATFLAKNESMVVSLEEYFRDKEDKEKVVVVLFGGMSPDKSFGQGLKAGLGDAFTVFLNTISAFGNIMSYIRLFAVGMASLAIAQSFNNMAFGFKGPLVVAAVLILLIGHGLNIVMGLLSVVVHGVRLNLLEFSGQLGMEWAGIAYDPFKKQDKLKK